LQHPECNVAWQGEVLVKRKTVDLGLLVDTPDGLMLTTIRDADGLDLANMKEAVAAAVARARAGVLGAGDLASRSLTISNLGMYAIDGFSSVIRAPDPMSLAVGRVRTVPRWDGVGWSSARVLPLTLSVDHRALDGASAARLLTTLEATLAGAEGSLQ
jgi:pyruvate dehydrogenase E2 component (dihydrolipoamide acetyltransferase)